MGTILYSALHFLVDFLCAHSMFRLFTSGPEGYGNILIYNFCAFALQMPLGTLLDSMTDQRTVLPVKTAVLGVMLTILGSFTHPAVLGVGNALFHVGGGVGVIREDHSRGWNGRGLGVFVAPGALGLYLGSHISVSITLYLAAAMMGLTIPLFRLSVHRAGPLRNAGANHLILPILCCFLVVVLRSYVGMAVAFPWKQGFGMGPVSAVVLGKVAGGFSAARFGTRNTVFVSLGLAAICYLFSESVLFGVPALFFFNMTMPVTLYQLAIRFPRLPGFCFGLLTFGLFLGFLPVYLGWDAPLSWPMLGAAGCLASLVLLLPVCGREQS